MSVIEMFNQYPFIKLMFSSYKLITNKNKQIVRQLIVVHPKNKMK